MYMALSDLEASELLGFGSLAQHRAWVAFPDAGGAGRFEDRYEDELRDLGVSVRTADEEARSLEAGFEELARFLGLVGLAALVLGGIGVGSATSVYLAERRPAVAVLRCLGAGRGTVLGAYLLQSATLGLVGGLVGVLAGSAAQLSLPTVLQGVLPFTITPRLRPEGMAAGLLIGAWVSIAFALLPLLRLHAVPPAAALRAAPEEGKGWAPFATAAVALGVAASVFGVAWIQIGEADAALVVTLALAGVFALLGAIAWGIARLVRVALPPGAPFPLRQGLSGLFRPGNQTGAVVTTLGLGAFLVGALLVVESGLRAELDLSLGEDQPSLVLFDIQEGQVEGIRTLLRSEGLPEELVPIVPARLAAVGGTAVSDLMASREGPTWMYRRVYRNTYYGRVGDAEEVVEGRWWDGPGDDPPRVAEAVAAGAVRVSIERDLALDLGITVGDRIAWDVQGVPVESVVASLRAVEWASFRPNFFAVFEPGAMDQAPKTFVALAAPGDPAAGDRIQRGVVDAFPNVSFLDVSLVRETLERIAGQVSLVLRSMAGFVLAAGAVVLLASLLASRFRRRRESALLKALGASGGTIRRVLLSEYAAIGTVAGGAGVLLGGVGGRLLLDWRFGLAGATPWGTLLGLWVGCSPSPSPRGGP
jgi:putative ABC transport system permease protein